MHKILVLGAGKTGVPVSFFLSESNDYEVILADANQRVEGPLHPATKFVNLDITNKTALTELIMESKIESIVSCLPYFCNAQIAEICLDYQLNYFDLTEDVLVGKKIDALAKNATTAFVPHCGLAPGFINIAAHDRMQSFENIDSVLMRVGALPQYSNNKLKYAINWSIDGLVNEYSHAGCGLVNGQEEAHQPLEGLESIEIDGVVYEAFNTSGGMGSLGRSWSEKVSLMNYKTIRYPGHCELMHFLMNDLKLKDHPPLLKQILAGALPSTIQDVVIIYIAITGQKNKNRIEDTYVKKIYPQTIAGKHWAAIQVTTASGVCAVIDTVVSNPQSYQGIVLQEDFKLSDIIDNRFGFCYK